MVSKTKSTGNQSGGSVVSNWNGAETFGQPKYFSESEITYFSKGPPYTAPLRWDHWVDNRRQTVINGQYISNMYKYPKYTRNYFDLRIADYVHEYPKPESYDNVFITQALADINPNKPSFDLPLFLFELRELPGAIRDIGKSLNDLDKSTDGMPSDASPAGAHLSWQFGWKPLLSDLQSLLDLAEETERRVNQLTKAHRRRKFEGNLLNTTTTTLTGEQTTAGYLDYNYKVVVKERAWFTCHYHVEMSQFTTKADGLMTEIELSREPNFSTMGSNRLKQMRWALGLRVSPAQLWNMLPWSWMVDYFSNIGTFLETNQGYYKSKAKDLCIMYSHDSVASARTVRSRHWKTDGLTVSGTSTMISQRRRIYGDPSARVQFSPFINKRQGSILLSLAMSPTSRYTRSGG